MVGREIQGSRRKRGAVPLTPASRLIQQELLYLFPVPRTQVGLFPKEHIEYAPGLDWCHRIEKVTNGLDFKAGVSSPQNVKKTTGEVAGLREPGTGSCS